MSPHRPHLQDHSSLIEDPEAMEIEKLYFTKVVSEDSPENSSSIRNFHNPKSSSEILPSHKNFESNPEEANDKISQQKSISSMYNSGDEMMSSN